MQSLTLRVYRLWTEDFADTKGRAEFAAQRSKLLHSLSEALDLDVQDWGETDAEYPREVVEVIIALGSAGVFTAVVSALQVWLERDKIKEAEIVAPGGFSLKLTGAHVRDIAESARALMEIAETFQQAHGETGPAASG